MSKKNKEVNNKSRKSLSRPARLPNRRKTKPETSRKARKRLRRLTRRPRRLRRNSTPF